MVAVASCSTVDLCTLLPAARGKKKESHCWCPVDANVAFCVHHQPSWASINRVTMASRPSSVAELQAEIIRLKDENNALKSCIPLQEQRTLTKADIGNKPAIPVLGSSETAFHCQSDTPDK